MNNLHSITNEINPPLNNELLKTTEIWQRDNVDANLWHGEQGLIINTAALEERKFFFDVIVLD